MEERNEFQESNNKMVEVEISYEPYDEKIDQMARDRHHKDVNEFLGKLFNVLEVGRTAKSVVNPDLNYVVKFTPALLKKMEEHDIRFLQDTVTGDLLPDLYDYTAKGIGGKIRLEIKGKPTGQDITNLSHSINNLIEQQRYDALIQEIHQLHLVAKRIERGQDNDRFAKVLAGRKHLLDALQYEGSEEERRKFILDALGLLRQGREAIEKTLLDKLDALEMVPENRFKRLWRCFSNPDYFPENTGRYDDIQEYFQYYYLAIQPMAYAYTVLGQPHLISNMLEDCRKVFEHRNAGCLISIELLLPNRTFENMWYKNPEAHEQKLLEAFNEQDEEKYIIVKGSEILEVIEDGREETKETD